MTRRALSLFGNALFVFYCTSVGVYLLLRPWSARHLGLLHLAAGWSDLRVLSRGLGEPPSESG